MIFTLWGKVAMSYLNPETLEAETVKKVKANLHFSDICRTRLFFADPDRPFTHTIVMIDDTQMNVKMTVNMFSSFLHNSMNHDLFTRISNN